MSWNQAYSFSFQRTEFRLGSWTLSSYPRVRSGSYFAPYTTAGSYPLKDYKHALIVVIGVIGGCVLSFRSSHSDNLRVLPIYVLYSGSSS